MGAPSLGPTPQVHRSTIRTPSPSTFGASKPTVPVKRLAGTVLSPSKHFKNVSSDIDILAKIVGLSPGKVSKETRDEVVKDLFHPTKTKPMSTMARQRTDPELTPPKQSQDNRRPKTPQQSRQEQQHKAKMGNLEQTKKTIKCQQELQTEDFNPFGLLRRPTRSTFQAPDIKPLPKVPLERKRKTPEEIRAEVEKRLKDRKATAEQRRKDKETLKELQEVLDKTQEMYSID
jgi:hypothetical protein